MNLTSTAEQLAKTICEDAQAQFAATKHSSRLTEKGAAEKMRKLLEKTASEHLKPVAPLVLEAYQWRYETICNDSLVDFRMVSAFRHPEHLFQMFEPGDVIWTGETWQQGEDNFRTREDRLSSKAAPPSFTCPSTYIPGHLSRAKLHILHKRFLVVESDTLDKDTTGAIFKWLVDVNGLRLRAVVDTAGKSLHAWFDYPHEQVDNLKLVLPALGCDKRMFVPCQPCRMPGVGRNGAFQRLIYQS